MRKSLIAILCTLFFIILFGCHQNAATKRNNLPNILLINADDLGFMDTELYGNHDFDTPNILKLAAAGMTFTQAYASAANCAPSRACMLSGQYSPRHGIYTVGNSKRGISKNRKLIPIVNTTTLADSVTTLAEELQKAGYRTVTIGKWHIGENPASQGFDVNIGGTHAGHPKSYFSPYRNPELIDGPDGEYLTDRLTAEAISQMTITSDQPFFIYLPYFAVHTPLQGKESLVEKYIDRGFDMRTATYGAMVENMDVNVGKLLSAMDDFHLRNNTLVIFTSDNGGIAALHSQQPLRGGKGSYYEGGIRVPLILSWPGTIVADSWSHLPVTNIDFYPTLLSVIQQEPSAEKILDGIDISREWSSEQISSDRSLFWHYPIYLQSYDGAQDDARDTLFRTRPGSTVREGKWKLHYFFEDNAWELYDLVADPGERTNLIETHPDVAAKMKKRLTDWWGNIGAPLPDRKNPEYEFQ